MIFISGINQRYSESHLGNCVHSRLHVWSSSGSTTWKIYSLLCINAAFGYSLSSSCTTVQESLILFLMSLSTLCWVKSPSCCPIWWDPLEVVSLLTFTGERTRSFTFCCSFWSWLIVLCLCSGHVVVRGEAVSNTRDLFVVTFSGNKLANKDGFFGTSDPFMEVSRYVIPL